MALWGCCLYSTCDSLVPARIGHVMRSAEAVMTVAVNVCAENNTKSDMGMRMLAESYMHSMPSASLPEGLSIAMDHADGHQRKHSMNGYTPDCSFIVEPLQAEHHTNPLISTVGRQTRMCSKLQRSRLLLRCRDCPHTCWLGCTRPTCICHSVTHTGYSPHMGPADTSKGLRCSRQLVLYKSGCASPVQGNTAPNPAGNSMCWPEDPVQMPLRPLLIHIRSHDHHDQCGCSCNSQAQTSCAEVERPQCGPHIHPDLSMHCWGCY